MEAKFSNRVKEVISLSREEALRLGHDYIGTEHLLLGMIREGEGVAVSILKKLGIPLDELRTAIERAVKGTANHNVKNMANIPLTRQSEKVLKITYLEAKIFKSQLIGTEHLLLSILRDEDNIATQILNKFEVNYDSIKEMLEMQSDTGNSPRARAEAEDGDEDGSWLEKRVADPFDKTAEDNIENTELGLAIHHCLSKLPAKQAEIFKMKTILGYDTEAICNEFDITASNLWVIIHRARTSLASCLEENWL